MRAARSRGTGQRHHRCVRGRVRGRAGNLENRLLAAMFVVRRIEQAARRPAAPLLDEGVCLVLSRAHAVELPSTFSSLPTVLIWLVRAAASPGTLR